MKKIIIASVLVTVIIFAVAFNQVSAQSTAPSQESNVPCLEFTRYLYVGMRNGQVSDLQQYLYNNGYLKVKPTGYFGALTLIAVRNFQTANGIAGTGTVGPITRSKLREFRCGPVVDWNIKVTSPQAGAVWQAGSEQTISWTSKLPPSFAAYDYTVILTPVSSCSPGLVCAMLMAKPYVLVESTKGDSIKWIVGSTTESGSVVPRGNYNIQVCVKNSTQCGQSGKVTITDSIPTHPFTFSVTTDKYVYSQNEPIQIAFKVTNTADTPQTIQFNNGCQATYKIGNYDYMTGRMCTMAMGSITLQPHVTHTWYLTHLPSDYTLPAGVHAIEVSLLNNLGSASAQVTIMPQPTY